MAERAERATGAQADLLARLIESSAFTDAERDAVKAELFGAYPLTKDRATKLIDRTLKVLKARKANAGPGHSQGSRPATGATGAGGRPPAKAPVNAETLKGAVFINRGVYYQPPSGPPQLLISAEELDARKMTQQRWIDERKKELGIGGRF